MRRVAQKRRLRGIAALSAGALATVGLASGVGAADECADDACAASSTGLTELIKAFGGDAISAEDIERIEAFYKVTDIDNPADAFTKLAPLFENSDALPEDAMLELLAVYREMGIEIPADALGGLEGLAEMDELFLKNETEASSGGADSLNGEAGVDFEEYKVTYDETPPQLIDVEDANSLIAEALLKKADSGQVDAATVKALLEELSEDG
jgi:hypothetical protein